jgi:HEAT repeat protein
MKSQIRDAFVRIFQKLVFVPKPILAWTSPALAVLVALAVPAYAGETTSSAKTQERALIQLLRSDAFPDLKAITCKKLAIYGTGEAVSALAPLLADERLTSWARIALEAIPGSAPDKALRKAAGKLHGRLLVGVIDSIGSRRDAKSVSVLTRKLNDSDTEVASAAAVSLGEIGGQQAAKALQRALGTAPESVRPAIAEGCVRCAENFLANAKAADAVKLYDAVRQSTLPRQRILEGIRGAILARGQAGIPLLLEQLQSNDRPCFNIGLRVARELPGKEATEAVAGAFRAATPDRQPLLLLALADRGDAAATTVVTEAARSGGEKLRRVAIEILDRLGDPSTLPVLLDDAADEDPEISQASLAALTRLAGTNVDSELFARLQNSSGRMRRALITLAARRGIEKAAPLIAQSVGDPDMETRSAAIEALTALGGSNEVTELVQALEKSKIPDERARIENALVTLSGRIGTKCVPSLLSLIWSAKQEDRKVALHALVAAGGSDALAAVAAATDDKDQSFQEEALRTLCTWPNAWPEDAAVAEPLLRAAKTDSNSSHGILAMRGYLQFLLGDEKLKKEDKLAKLEEIIPLLRRTDEKTTAIAVLQGISSAAALERLAAFASEPAVANDACGALVRAVTQNKPSISIVQRQQALRVVIQKSTQKETRQKAEEALKSLQ